MALRATIAKLTAVAAIAAGTPVCADNRSKPGEPRTPPPRVGAEITAPPPAATIEAEIGATGAGAGAPPPPGLRARDGEADYGFSSVREAETDPAPALGGGPRPESPNK